MSLESPPEPPLPPLGRPIRHRYGRRLLGVAALGVVLLWLGVKANVRYYTVSSGSMEPTLRVGERIAVDPSLRAPRVGEIIAFHPPVGADPSNPQCGLAGQGSGSSQVCSAFVPRESRSVFIKRVVAGPGSTVALIDGHAVVDGVRVAEPYIDGCGAGAACNFPTPVTVMPGDYFVLGDNRGVSDDSRFWGPVPRAWIIGTVVHCTLLGTLCNPVR